VRTTGAAEGMADEHRTLLDVANFL